MPYVDVAVTGQVTNGVLKYAFENPVADTHAIDMLGYNIKRTHTNVHEGNCYIDFKVGSTALSSIAVVQAGVGYDVDNMPRYDAIGNSPSLGVEFFLSGDIESRGHAVGLPDYVQFTQRSAAIYAAPGSPEVGSQTLHVGVSAPFDYAYRLLYELNGNLAAPTAQAAVAFGALAAVYVPVRAAWFALGADAWRAQFVEAHNASAALAMPGNAPVMSFSTGQFRITHTVGFRVYELDRAAYVLCGTSTVRHGGAYYDRHAATTVNGATVAVNSLASVQVLGIAGLAVEAPAYEQETHDARVAAIARSIASGVAITADAVCGELYSARLRPGHYPIGSVVHAPYPVVLDVEEASAEDATDSAQVPAAGARATDWSARQAALGARPHKSLSITRRQAADGLIKELQDAMNYAVFPPGDDCVVTDPHSLPGLMPQYTADISEFPEVFPFVYDQNVPHVDNPAYNATGAIASTMQQYLYEYDIGHQSADVSARRRQRVYVTLEDAGGGPDATGLGRDFQTRAASLQYAGWNGYKCTRVRICTAEARNGDNVQKNGGLAPISTDAEAAKGGAVTQQITLLFGSGPNRARSIHRALGFEDRDYTRPSKFVYRKPQIATIRTETAGELADLVQTDDARQIHIVNRPDRVVAGAELAAVSGIVEGLTYTVDGAPGRVYPRYVPVLSVTGAEAFKAAAAAPFDADFHYKGGKDHFAYYTVLGYQAPHAYNLDSDPLLVSVGVAVNERVHAQADCTAGTSAFALLPIGHADHAEPRTYRDGSVFQQAMLNYKLSGYVTAPHAVGVDRILAGSRNFGRVAPNAQDAASRRWGLLAADAAALATRDVAPCTRCIHMIKAGDFGVKTLVLDEPTRVASVTLTFSVPAKSPYAYDFGAQEVIILLRLQQTRETLARPRNRTGT